MQLDLSVFNDNACVKQTLQTLFLKQVILKQSICLNARKVRLISYLFQKMSPTLLKWSTVNVGTFAIAFTAQTTWVSCFQFSSGFALMVSSSSPIIIQLKLYWKKSMLCSLCFKMFIKLCWFCWVPNAVTKLRKRKEAGDSWWWLFTAIGFGYLHKM